LYAYIIKLKEIKIKQRMPVDGTPLKEKTPSQQDSAHHLKISKKTHHLSKPY
jgi:hypothetical protein